jgi:hypothetical protein
VPAAVSSTRLMPSPLILVLRPSLTVHVSPTTLVPWSTSEAQGLGPLPSVLAPGPSPGAPCGCTPAPYGRGGAITDQQPESRWGCGLRRPAAVAPHATAPLPSCMATSRPSCKPRRGSQPDAAVRPGRYHGASRGLAKLRAPWLRCAPVRRALGRRQDLPLRGP